VAPLEEDDKLVKTLQINDLRRFSFVKIGTFGAK